MVNNKQRATLLFVGSVYSLAYNTQQLLIHRKLVFHTRRKLALCVFPQVGIEPTILQTQNLTEQRRCYRTSIQCF